MISWTEKQAMLHAVSHFITSVAPSNELLQTCSEILQFMPTLRPYEITIRAKGMTTSRSRKVINISFHILHSSVVRRGGRWRPAVDHGEEIMLYLPCIYKMRLSRFNIMIEKHNFIEVNNCMLLQPISMWLWPVISSSMQIRGFKLNDNVMATRLTSQTL